MAIIISGREMGLKDLIKKKKKTQQNNGMNIQTQGDPFADPFSSNNTQDPFSGGNDPFADLFNGGNQQQTGDPFTGFGGLQQSKEQKKKQEPHPIITFIQKTRTTLPKIIKKTEEILKGKPPVAVFRTYSHLVVVHEDKGIKLIINGYETAYWDEWKLKGQKWHKITVKEVLNNEYTGDQVTGRGFLLTKFILPKTYAQNKLLYYEISIYVGEFKGTLTKPAKVGEKYKKLQKVGIHANLLIVIREYSLVNEGGKFVRKEHILYTGGKLSDKLMEFIKEDKKKKLSLRKKKEKPPEINVLEGTGETEEVIDKTLDNTGTNSTPGGEPFNIGGGTDPFSGGSDPFGDIFGGSNNQNNNDPFSDLF